MSARKKSCAEVITIPESRWSYAMLARHLEISTRTLKRLVVCGSIPQPTLVGTRCYWSGVALVAARAGARIPGTFDYSPNAREAKRTASIEHRKQLEAKGRRLRAARAGHAKRTAGGAK